MLFGSLVSQIQTAERTLKGLEGLIATMRNTPTAFDNEDIQMVAQYYKEVQSQLEACRQKLSERERVYNTTVLSMQKAIETREEVLGSVDDVLESNPQLMEQLVAKQTRLYASLKTMKERLASVGT